MYADTMHSCNLTLHKKSKPNYMEINEYNIKQRHSDELIGCFSLEGGYGHFVDLRGSEGEVIRSFYENGEHVEIRYDGKGLVEHEFYRFK